MDCEQALEYISASIDGELTKQEAAALAEHLAGCAECRALAAELGALSAGVAALEAEPPPGLSARIMAAMAEPPPPSVPEAGAKSGGRVRPFAKQARTLRLPLAAAAVLAVAFCLGGVLLWSARSGTDNSSAASPAALSPAGLTPSAAWEDTDGPTADDGGVMPYQADEGQRSSDPENEGEAGQSIGTTELPGEPEQAPKNTVEGVGASFAPEAADGAADNDTAVPEGLTQEEALDAAFQYLGGRQLFPNATLEEECGYLLAIVEGSGTQGQRRLALEAVSDNGEYWIFRLYDSYWSDTGGGERAIVIRRYAVGIEDGQVLASDDSGYDEAVGS